MTASNHVRTLVEAHFALRLRPSAEREMRAHLATCPECRAYYEQHLLFASIDPAAPTAIQRLGAGLGLEVRRRPATTWRWTAAGLTLAAAALAAVFALQRTAPEVAVDTGFTARGTDSRAADLSVYRVGDRDRLHALGDGDPVGPDDELAFAYRNPTGKAYLMVFAVDSAGRVYWYFPSWTDPADNPAAVPIAAGAVVHNLPEAVRHQLPTGTLQIHALFTDRVATVREVEARLGARAEKRATLDLYPGDLEWSRALEVGAR